MIVYDLHIISQWSVILKISASSIKQQYTEIFLLKYRILDGFKASDRILNAGSFSFDEGVVHTVRNKWYGQYKWLFDYDVCDQSMRLVAIFIYLTLFSPLGTKCMERGCGNRRF
jgi:hypothetical protein